MDLVAAWTVLSRQTPPDSGRSGLYSIRKTQESLVYTALKTRGPRRQTNSDGPRDLISLRPIPGNHNAERSQLMLTPLMRFTF